MTPAQISNRLPLTFEREEGETPGTVVFRFSGPFTARAVFECQSPDAVSQMFDLQLMPSAGAPAAVNIFDLTDVPYMDSSGLGIVVRHYVRCKDKGVGFMATGVGPRVLELFKLTKIDAVIPIIVTGEEATEES
jgi:anti-anti-sigma factor